MDGTIVYDDKYHLGRQRNWKKMIRILPNVVSGLKKLNKSLPNSKIYLITNQPGVAIKDFPLLTQSRAEEVCKFIIKKLSKSKIKIDGYAVCGKASLAYTKRRSEYIFNKKLVGDFSCIKPKPGMVNAVLKKTGWKKKDTRIFVIGDREGDVKTGINSNGFGVIVPFKKEPGEEEKVRKLKSKKIHIAKDFSKACEWIIKKES